MKSHKLTRQFYVVKLYTGKHPYDNDIQFIYRSREILHYPNQAYTHSTSLKTIFPLWRYIDLQEQLYRIDYIYVDPHVSTSNVLGVISTLFYFGFSLVSFLTHFTNNSFVYKKKNNFFLVLVKSMSSPRVIRIH